MPNDSARACQNDPVCGDNLPSGCLIVNLDECAFECLDAAKNASYHLGRTCWFDCVVTSIPYQRAPAGKQVPWFGQVREAHRPRTMAHWNTRCAAIEDATLPGDAHFGSLAREFALDRVPDRVDAIEHQGFAASCAGFGIAAVVETSARMARPDHRGPSLSEGDLFFGGGGSCAAGAEVFDLVDRSMSAGLLPVRLERYPYDGFAPKPHAPAAGKRTRVAKWVKFGRGPEDIDRMRWWIQNRGPVWTVESVARDFLLYQEGIYRPVPGNEVWSHCFCITGWRHFGAGDPRNGWRCRNSFGPNWGEDGYFWAPFQRTFGMTPLPYFAVDSFASYADPDPSC
jgi:hypothetical protein